MDNGASEVLGVRHTLPHGRTIIIALTVSVLNIPIFLNVLSYNAAAYNVSDDYIKWDEQRRMTQISYIAVGILAYALFAFLFQRYRRKACLYAVCISQLITSILLLCTNSYWLLHVSRASSAISDVGAGMFCIIYVSEIAPDDIRGSLVAFHKLLYALTELLPIVLYLFHVQLKSFPFSIISIVISVHVAMWAYVGVPESPIYFLRRDDMLGAKESYESLHGNDTNIAQMISNRKKILEATRSHSQTTTSIFQECTNRRTLTFTCMAIALYFLRIIDGFWVARFHIEAILWRIPEASYNDDSHFLIIDAILISLGNLIVVVFCDRVGRKVLLLISSFVSSVSLIAYGINLYVYEMNESDIWDTVRIIFIGISLVYLLCFNLGISILPEVIISDIFPPKILSTQIAILGSFHLCVDYVIHYEIYKPLEPPLSGYGLFWLFGVLSGIGALFLIKFPVETKCRPSGIMLMDTEESVLYSALQDVEE